MAVVATHECVTTAAATRVFSVVTNDVSDSVECIHDSGVLPCVGSKHKRFGIVRTVNYERRGKFLWLVTVEYTGKPRQLGAGNWKCSYCGCVGVYGERCKGCGANDAHSS